MMILIDITTMSSPHMPRGFPFQNSCLLSHGDLYKKKKLMLYPTKKLEP